MAQDNSNEGLHYVVDGAIYKCQYGTVPSPIKPTSNQKVIAENKFIVTEDDNVFQTPTCTFGTCSQNSSNPPTCNYANGKWDPDTLLKQGGKNVVSEDSKMKCPVFQGEISCVFHGQVASVKAPDAESFEIETVENPFAVVLNTKNNTKEGEKKGNNIVSSITVSLDKKGKKDSVSSIRAKSVVELDANATNKNLVHWAITTKNQKGEIDDLVIYKYVGAPFKLTLYKPNTYYVEGFGSVITLNTYLSLEKNKPLPKDVTIPIDSKCSKTITVKEKNDIKEIHIDGKVRNGNKYDVKQGKTVTIKPNFVFDYDENVDICRYEITKGDGSAVDEDEYKFIDTELMLTPSNANEEYKVTFFLYRVTCKTSESELINQMSVTIKSYNEAFLRCDFSGMLCKQDSDKSISLRRPNDTLRFDVYKIEDGEEFLVENAVLTIFDKTSSKKEKLNGNIYKFTKEGVFVIEADLSKSGLRNGGVKGEDGYEESANGKTDKIQHTITIAHNTVKSVSIPHYGLFYVGIKYPVEIVYSFGERTIPYERKITKLTIDDGIVEKGMVFVAKEGSHKLEATLNGKTQFVEYEFVKPSIKKWEFCDYQKRYLDYVEFKKPFYLHLHVPVWASKNDAKEKNKVQLSLWLHSKGKYVIGNNYSKLSVKELEEKVEMDENGEVFLKIGEDSDLWTDYLNTKVYKDNWFDKCADLYFCVSDPVYKDVTGLELLSEDRKGFYWGGQHGRYLHVTNQKILSGYFSDAKGNKLIDVQKYDSEICALVRLINYSGEERKKMEFILMENCFVDKQVKTEKTVVLRTPDSDGVSVVPIKLNASNLPGDSKRPHLFYFFIKNNLGETLFTYPSNRFEVKNYDAKKLKNEKNGKFIGSYLYQLKVAKEVDDKLNSTIAKIAPVVVGEEVSTNRKKAGVNTKCFCCRDFTVDEVKKFIESVRGEKLTSDNIWENSKDVDDKSLGKFTEELNLVFRRYRINQCIQKITILAIAAVETALFKSSTEEKSNFASSKSKWKGRGLLHLTEEVTYKKYNQRVSGHDILVDPDFIAKKIHYIVDSGATYFTNNRFKCDYKWENIKARRDKFKESCAVKRTLSLKDLCSFMVLYDEEKYFFLINKLLNGYLKGQVNEPPNNWTERKNALKNLKEAFKYDPKVCEEVENDFPSNNTEWHDPLAIMQICAYSSNGHLKTYYNTFGYRTSTRRHQGVDLFAVPGTEVFACLDGRVVFAGNAGDAGYGNMLVLCIYDPTQVQIFKDRRKSNFEPYHSKDLIEGTGFDSNSDMFFLAYCHLTDFCVIEGDDVRAGEVIGHSGETGNAKGTKAPHVHFEVRSKQKPGGGHSNRCNPALYFDFEQYKSYKEINVKGKKKAEVITTDLEYTDKINIVQLDVRKVDGTIVVGTVKSFETDSNLQFQYTKNKK